LEMFCTTRCTVALVLRLRDGVVDAFA